MNAGVTARSLLRLRPEQVVYRPWGRVAHRLVSREREITATAGAMDRITRWSRAVQPMHRRSWISEAQDAAAGKWTYIGIERSSPVPPFQVDAPRLWRYELHYRRWLAGAALLKSEGAIPVEAYETLLTASMRSVASHHEAWEPYVLARRIWNELAAAGFAEEAALADSASRAAAVLSRIPEKHIAGNHLLADRAAVAGASILLTGECSSAPVDQYIAELDRQTDEDGFHEERSPWYALLAWTDLQNVRAALEMCGERSESLDAHADRQRRALGVLAHPDGTLPSFHDTSSEHSYEPLAAELQSREGAWDLARSGFAGWRGNVLGATLSLVSDFGSPRPRHQPGHQHASPFAYELWWDGAWIRALGISTYEANERRLLERGIGAYAAAQVDDRQPAELWSAFRMGRGYTVRERAVDTSNGLRIAATHDGFRPGTMCRTLELDARSHAIRIVDRFAGNGTITSRLPLAHDVVVEHGVQLVLRRGARRIGVITSAPIRVVDALCHPEFGVPRPTHVIEITGAGAPAEISYELRMEAD